MTCNAFSIKKINILSSWVFNLPKNTECTICRCNLNGPSLYNQEKGLESYVVSGLCQHSYHNECIKPWVDKNKLCPICFQKWELIPINNNKTMEISNNIINDINDIIKSNELNIVNNAKKIIYNIDDLLNNATLKISHLDKHGDLKDDISDDELPDLIQSTDIYENIFKKDYMNYLKTTKLSCSCATHSIGHGCLMSPTGPTGSNSYTGPNSSTGPTGPTGPNISKSTSPKITGTDNAWTKHCKTINIIPPDSSLSKEINKITKKEENTKEK